MKLIHSYVWAGADINLAPFGAVRRGDLLRLTDKEHRYVQDDPSFRPAVKGDKQADNFLPITDKMTGAEREAAEKVNRRERERLASLSNSNDDERRLTEAVRQLTFDELVTLADRMESKGAGLGINRNPTKSELVVKISRRLDLLEKLDEPTQPLSHARGAKAGA